MMRSLVSHLGSCAFIAGILLAGCAGDGGAGEVELAPKPDVSNAAGIEEVVAEPMENPCDCFNKGLTRGQQRYCRESKRNVMFLEALRKCGTAEISGVSAVDNLPGDGMYTMNVEQSIIQWRGSKGGMQESGTVPFRSCTFEIKSSALVSGNAVVEMNAIKATSVEGLSARELGKHLRGEDFFDVAQYPTAAFTFDGGRVDGRGSFLMEGKLNVKGITKPVTAIINFGSSDPVVATVSLSFNRADFNVRYGSGTFFDNLGDELIADEVDLQMVLVEDVTQRKSTGGF